jgi:hypothetical protein
LERLDREVVAHFKAAGERWRTRINETLKAAIGSPSKRGPRSRRMRGEPRSGTYVPIVFYFESTYDVQAICSTFSGGCVF